MITQERLEQIKARAERAQYGPINTIVGMPVVVLIFGHAFDAGLASYAHTDIPDLIAEVERLRARVAALESARADEIALVSQGGAGA